MRLRDVNWNQVHSFYEVARCLSMSRAARHLDCSVATVSEQIKRLETRLDVSLFRRVARRLELTPEGERLYRCAKDVFAAGHRFVDAFAPDAVGGYAARVGIQETLLIVATRFVAAYWDVFAPFGTVGTSREIFAERLVERVLKGELDWAVVLAPPKAARVEFREIGAFEVAFCCASALHARFKEERDILRALPLARNAWDVSLNKLVDARLRDAGIVPSEIVESEHRDFCLALARRGRCVATLSTIVVGSDPAAAGLHAFRLGEPIEQRLYAVWSKDASRALAVRKLRELLDAPKTEGAGDPELQLRVADVPAEWLNP